MAFSTFIHMCLLLTPWFPSCTQLPLWSRLPDAYTYTSVSRDRFVAVGGGTWFQHRRMLTPAFHHDILKSWSGLMADSVRGSCLRSSSLVTCTCSHLAQLAKSTLRYLCPSHVNQTQPPRMTYSELNMRQPSPNLGWTEEHAGISLDTQFAPSTRENRPLVYSGSTFSHLHIFNTVEYSRGHASKAAQAAPGWLRAMTASGVG